MNRPNESTSDPWLRGLGVRPWERPATEFPAMVQTGVLAFGTTGPSAVAVTGVLAYSNGFEFWVTRLLRPDGPGFMHGPGPHPPAGRSPATRGVVYQIGLEFADGSQMRTGENYPPPMGDLPDRPILHRDWRAITGHREDARCWVWPLPPLGRLDFICWLGEAETRVGMESQLILEASRRSTRAVWQKS